LISVGLVRWYYTEEGKPARRDGTRNEK